MKQQGFSLIELLVVLAIAGTLLALVGPLGYQSVERVRTQTELVALQRWYDRVGYLAFIHGTGVSVTWQGDSDVIAMARELVIAEKQVARLSPVDKSPIVFTSAGMPNRRAVTFETEQGNTHTVELTGVLSLRSAY